MSEENIIETLKETLKESKNMATLFPKQGPIIILGCVIAIAAVGIIEKLENIDKAITFLDENIQRR